MWLPFLYLVGSDRNFHLKISELFVMQSGQSFCTGFLKVVLANRTISKLWSVTSGSVTVRSSWPDRRAPVEEVGLPWNMRGGDSMSITSFAGFAAEIVGLFLGLPFAGELERPRPGTRLPRFSLWWKMSMTPDFRS